MFKDVFKNFKSHCMTGISYMIPVIVIGGFCTAIARLCGNVDVEGTLGYAFISAGNAAFGLMMSVLCAGIAYSICGKPGIAPGVVAGYLSTRVFNTSPNYRFSYQPIKWAFSFTFLVKFIDFLYRIFSYVMV